ncbi:TPA: hypothetical protein HGT63_01865 [Escherichia coli]|nr:hypothetical protein D4M45_14780 [Escherichia coli]HAG7823679.1 hypothetical protein [Escherichia coli]
MAVKASGRFVPPSAFAAGTGKTFTGAYAWNAPREAVGRERPLSSHGIRSPVPPPPRMPPPVRWVCVPKSTRS